MPNCVIICGLNGAGKSTLGRRLAEELGWTFADIEDYVFPDPRADYDESSARTRQEAAGLLLEDMRKRENFILASVKGNYGEAVTSRFTRAVFVRVPREIRMRRVRERSYRAFRDRMLPGGDLYEREEHFFNQIGSRSEREVLDWLDTLGIPVLRVDGTRPVEESVRLLAGALSD